ncbi:14133_t:CDS:1, partial [Ambispora leptoticha]
ANSREQEMIERVGKRMNKSSTSESKQRASLGKRKVNKFEEVIKLKYVGERKYKQVKVSENR